MAAQVASVSPTMAVLQVLSGFWSARAVYIAAKLGLADLVQDGPKTAAQLAVLTGTHAPSLYRVLRALASIRWFEEDAAGRFGPTVLTSGLQTGVPGSLRSLAMTELGEEHYPAWGDLLFSVRTGELAFNRVFGMANWEFWASHPENAQIFNQAIWLISFRRAFVGFHGCRFRAAVELHPCRPYRPADGRPTGGEALVCLPHPLSWRSNLHGHCP